MDLLAEKSRLMFEAGNLFAPVRALVSDLPNLTLDERGNLKAKFLHDKSAFVHAMSEFVKANKGYDYGVHRDKVISILDGVGYRLFADLRNLDSVVDLDGQVEHEIRAVVEQIASIPIAALAEHFEAHSPFQAFVSLKHHLTAAIDTVLLADPYMDENVFYRFLSDLNAGVRVTLITEDGAFQKPGFQSVSRLFALQYGKAHYRLLVHPKFHDRHVCCDGVLFHVGGSLKDMAKKAALTVSKVDPVKASAVTTDLVTHSIEKFGPSVPAHP